MESEQLEYLKNYELVLTRALLSVAKDMRHGGSQLYQTDDLDEVWNAIAPRYMVDAIPNIAEYPAVSVAWAGYIGMAFAYLWDKDWSQVTSSDDAYGMLCSPRGFDAMDEYIVEDVLGYRMDSKEAQDIENLMRSLSHVALNHIRHEQIEPQSEMAFHVFARTVRAVFHVGASCELYRLGYKWVKQ